MPFAKHVLNVLTFLLLGIISVKGQISVSPSKGCMPLGLVNGNFNYSGPPATNILWNFGDGSNPSNVNPTQHTYPNIGTYNVTFTALVNGQPVVYTTSVAVNNPPTGNFTPALPSSMCEGAQVGFSGTSSLNGMQYTWDFGDNSLGSGANTSHIYGIKGTFVPILTIQDPATTCFTNVIGSPINISQKPVLVVASTNGWGTCGTTFNTSFSANGSTSGSPTGGVLTYNWNVNGTPATGVNTGPHTFNGIGKYNVILTATDNNNCSNTTTNVVTLEQPTVSAVVPPTVCVFGKKLPQPPIVEFIASVQSNAQFSTWNMGDGTTLTFPPPSAGPLTSSTTPYTNTIHVYNTPGPKIVTISVQMGTCTATIQKNIFVEEVKTQFAATPPGFTCEKTMTVTYLNQTLLNQTMVNSASPMTYTWDVIHWNQQGYYTSNLMTPTFVVTQGSLNKYTIYDTYLVNTTLRATSVPEGCWDGGIGHIFDTIHRPTAWFTESKAEGCAPLTVTFQAKPYYFNQAQLFPGYVNSVTNYTWYSGDTGPGSVIIGSLVPPATIPDFNFTYQNTGVYNPSLTIQTDKGCTHTSYDHTITVSDPPNITYNIPPGPICAGVPFNIQLGTSSNSSPVDHWHVASSNQYLSSCITDANPSVSFNQVGPQNFTITAYSKGCMTTVIPTQQMLVTGPLVKMNYKPNCGSRQVDFYYDLQDITSATIDFEYNASNPGVPNSLASGGSPFSTTGNISHTYAQSGTYTVMLKGFNTVTGCIYQQTVAVKVRALKADFDFVKPVICKGDSLEVDATLSEEEMTGGGRAYTWFFDALPPQQTSSVNYWSTNDFTVVGMHTASLLVKDDNGCIAIKTKTFRVASPLPNWTFNKNPICVSEFPVVLNNTTPQTPDAVTNYTWTLNLLNPSIVTIGNTAAHSPTTTYILGPGVQSQTFTIKLVAKDAIGCKDSTTKVIRVNDPIIKVTSVATACLPNSTITFSIAAANTHTSYQINFGDQFIHTSNSYTTNSTYNYLHTYNNIGVYTPTVFLVDDAGCSKTAVLMPITVQAPVVPSFTFFNVKSPTTTGYQFCMPVTLSVTSTSNHTLFPLTFNWHSGKPGLIFSTGTSSVSGATYTNTGIYNYSLQLITSPAGCTSIYSQRIEIYDPHIDFIIQPDDLKETYCLNEPITFKVTQATGVSSWNWDFGDGKINQFFNINFQSTFVYPNDVFPEITNGVLPVQLVGNTAAVSGCKDVKRRTLQIIRAKADFKRNEELGLKDYAHCLGKEDLFTNISTTNGSGLTYTWSLGDGQSTNATDVKHTFQAPGAYNIELKIKEGSASCEEKIVKTVTVFPLPTAYLSIPDSIVCPTDTFNVIGSGSPGVTGLLTGTLMPSQLTNPFTTSNSFTVSTKVQKTTAYELIVQDENGCVSKPVTDSILVPLPAPPIQTATTVVIGQQVQLDAHVGPGYSYSWTPQTLHLNLTNSSNPVSTSTADIIYNVQVVDEPLRCFLTTNTYSIFVLPLTSVDVPSAFTPNGDGVNDIVFAEGWGIRKLLYFKIFNRWGQLIFESNDLKRGWDGTFEGQPQNMETYVWQVMVETYVDANPTISKTGTIKLLR